MTKAPFVLLVAFLSTALVQPWVAAEDDPNTTCYMYTEGAPAAQPFTCVRPICVPEIEVCTTVVDGVLQIVNGVRQGGFVVLPPAGLTCTVSVQPPNPPSVSCTKPGPVYCHQVTAGASITNGDPGSTLTVVSACVGPSAPFQAECTAFGPNGSCGPSVTNGTTQLPHVCRWFGNGISPGHYSVTCLYS